MRSDKWLRRIVVCFALTMLLLPWNSVRADSIQLLFSDDFSTDKGWIDESNGNTFRDPTNEWLYWSGTRAEIRRFYIPISAASENVQLDFRFKVTEVGGNGGNFIGLTESFDPPPTPTLYALQTGVWVSLGRVGGYGPRVKLTATYEDGDYFDTISANGIHYGSLNVWREARLSINGTVATVIVWDENHNELGRLVRTLPDTHSAYNYLIVFTDGTGGWEWANGLIDDIELWGEPPNQPPVADANGPYLVAIGESVGLDGFGSSDPDEDPLTYSWGATGDPALGSIADSTFNAGSVAGITEVTLTVEDGRGGTATDTAMVVVYDPDGGFVTGGGWIDSPEGAYMPDEYPTGETFFLDAFDTNPTLSDSAVDGTWYPDRYPPAVFESVLFDGDNRLHVGISADDYLPYGSTFYNYQGRKFNLWNDLNTYITADLYIGTDWEGNQRHASMWATTYDTNGDISGYPIAGFTEGTGFRIFTQDTDQDTSNGYQAGWYDIGLPAGFTYGAWYTIRAELTESAYSYYINGELVWTDAITFDSVLWANMMLQAYNYGESYDVYWDNVGAGRIGEFPVGKATFGFVSKYKKGSSVPTGSTEFQFKAGDLNFHSTSYDWLLVTGSDYAKFKGTGTINGGGEYKFQIWAGDNSPDTFRIKIWYEIGEDEHVVYDNGMDQPISSGNVVVHSK